MTRYKFIIRDGRINYKLIVQITQKLDGNNIIVKIYNVGRKATTCVFQVFETTKGEISHKDFKFPRGD